MTDATANGHTGTLVTGGTWVLPGKVGAAGLSFDGVSAGMTFTAVATGTTFTIAAWIFPIASSTQYATLFTTASGGNGLFYYNNANLDLYTGADKISTGTITTGVWSHVAVVVNAGAYTFYINGVSAGTGTGITTYSATALGADTGGGRFKGNVDDMRLYSRALSAGDIAELIALATTASNARRPALMY